MEETTATAPEEEEETTIVAPATTTAVMIAETTVAGMTTVPRTGTTAPVTTETTAPVTMEGRGGGVGVLLGIGSRDPLFRKGNAVRGEVSSFDFFWFLLWGRLFSWFTTLLLGGSE